MSISASASRSGPDSDPNSGSNLISSSSSGFPKSDLAPQLQFPFDHLNSLHRDLVSLHTTLSGAGSTTTTATTATSQNPSSASSSSSSVVSSHADFVRRLSRIQGLLVELENRFKKQGVWVGELEKGQIPKGQAILQELLEDCHSLVEEIQQDLEKPAGDVGVGNFQGPGQTNALALDQRNQSAARRKSRVSQRSNELDAKTLNELSEEMVGPYKEMLSVFYQLVDLSSTGRGSEDDLRHLRRLQGLLDSCETKYKHVDNIWCGDLSKRHIPAGQSVMNDVCAKSHDLIEELYDELEIRSQFPEHHQEEKRHVKRQEKKHQRQLNKQNVDTVAGAGAGAGAAAGAGAGSGAGAGATGSTGLGASTAGVKGEWELQKERGVEGIKEKGMTENVREERA